MTRTKQLLIGTGIAIVLLFLGNLLYLDYKLLFEKKEENIIEAFTSSDGNEVKYSSPQTPGLTKAEVEVIVKEAIRSFKVQTNVPTSQSTIVGQSLVSGSQVKEFFIHLGSGSTSTEEWTDISGVEAYIDSTKYGGVKEVVFEASVNIPTGNQIVYIRLYNVTDKHPVWFSELSHEGGGSILLTSKPITLDSGNKLYRVQMKTSLKYLSNLSSARIKITVE